MLSLYVHVPFCQRKCSYCNFFIAPLDSFEKGNEFIEKYTNAILGEIDFWAEKFPREQLKTVYFGGGTPLKLGKENLLKIIDKIVEKFNLDFMEELSIELNPDPFDEVYDFMKTVNRKYEHFFRIRYSFGIQTFDDEILKSSNRAYTFNQLAVFLREIMSFKQHNNVYNFDFIAFGVKEKLWDIHKVDFFDRFLSSGWVDSISLYTIELFPGSKDFGKLESVEDFVYNEFSEIRTLLDENNFRRYEISNFSTLGKESIHNKVYWEMGDYIGLGMNASSFLKGKYMEKYMDNLTLNSENSKLLGVRFSNTTSWDKYFRGEYIDESKIIELSQNDFLVEKFFLAMRTNLGVENIDQYAEIFVDDRKSQLEDYEKEGLIYTKGTSTILTDEGMSVYNTIITNLVKEF